MLEVRGGIIGAGVLAQRRNLSRPTYLMPMSISYEQLPELHAFPGLLEGKSMRRPGQGWRRRLVGSIKYYGADATAFFKLLYAHYFGVKYGAIFVDYGEPIPVASLYNADSDITEGARDDFSACRLAFQTTSLRVFDLFNSLYRILPVHVLAAAVADRPGATLQEVREACSAILKRLRGLGRNVSSIDTLNPDQLLNAGIAQLRLQKGIWVRGDRLRVRSRQVVRYYAAATE
jgi:glycerol-3-phosphate O-acyltransferase